MTGSDTLARIKDAYTFSGDSVFLGALEFSGATHPEVPIFLPLSTLNRHGLISGATGTGKTKTLQKILE